jgi:hypothetical protein
LFLALCFIIALTLTTPAAAEQPSIHELSPQEKEAASDTVQWVLNSFPKFEKILSAFGSICVEDPFSLVEQEAAALNSGFARLSEPDARKYQAQMSATGIFVTILKTKKGIMCGVDGIVSDKKPATNHLLAVEKYFDQMLWVTDYDKTYLISTFKRIEDERKIHTLLEIDKIKKYPFVRIRQTVDDE